MKLLVLVLGGLAICLVSLFLTAMIIATHPWLAIGLIDLRPTITWPREQASQGGSAIGVPKPLWDMIQAVSQESACHPSAEDLAALLIFRYGSSYPVDPTQAISATAQVLCDRGYGQNRVKALNSYGGCLVPLCLGKSDFATLITSLGATFKIPSGVIDLAQTYVDRHVPYLFGGNSYAGIDCSGLVQQVFLALGIHLPRTAAEQYNATTRIPRDELRPGNLVFFANTYMPGISHVGIYIGDGMQINAPAEGQVVSTQPVFSGYWGAHYYGAGKVVINP